MQSPPEDQKPPGQRGDNFSSSTNHGNEKKRIAELEAERDELSRHLKSAQQRIHELEVSQGTVVSRIDSLLSKLGRVVEKSF